MLYVGPVTNTAQADPELWGVEQDVHAGPGKQELQGQEVPVSPESLVPGF